MKKLDPKSVWLFFINAVPIRLLPMLIFFYLYYFLTVHGISVLISGDKTNQISEFGGVDFNWLLLIILVSLIILWIWAKLSYHFYKYELREEGFSKESGVIRKKYVTIPYDRIQNVNINRGIVARILGLSSLQIQTAGASGAIIAEGILPGLSRDIAEQVRDELIKRARRSKNYAV